MSVSSLGELAVREGLIPEVERQRLADELRKAVHEGAPQSFARLLIRHGHSPDAVSRLLAGGQGLQQVACDACGASLASQSLVARAEYPCVCGSMILGFAPFAGEEGRPPTDHYPSVPPVPSQRERGTLRYDKVHELPAPRADNDATGPYRRILPLPEPVAEDRFQALLAAPLNLPDHADDDLGGLTLSPEELARLRGEDDTKTSEAEMTLSPAEYEQLMAKERAKAPTPAPAETTATTGSAPSLAPLIVILALLMIGLIAGVVALALD